MLKKWEDVSGCLVKIGDEEVATLKCAEVIFENLVIVIVGLVTLALFIMLIVGGFRYLVSGGDAKQTEAARNTIFWAIVGLILIIMAYIIIKALEWFTGVPLTEFKIPGGPTPTPTPP